VWVYGFDIVTSIKTSPFIGDIDVEVLAGCMSEIDEGIDLCGFGRLGGEIC